MTTDPDSDRRSTPRQLGLEMAGFVAEAMKIVDEGNPEISERWGSEWWWSMLTEDKLR